MKAIKKTITTLRFVAPIGVSALLLIGCGGAESTPDETELMADAGETNGERITYVTSLQLEPATFEHFFRVQGIVETDQNAQIFPEAPARITSVEVSEGDEVAKGKVLMRLDSRVIDNQIAELELRMSLAETVFKKQKSLWDQEIGSEIQYLEAKNNYESLTQSIKTLQAQRDMYAIKAPFSGIVDEIVPKEGEMANPAMPVARLINMDQSYIKADITESYLSQIKAGDSVKVEFPSLGVAQKTVIGRIGNFINPNNRTFKIRVPLSNKEELMRPNLLGDLMIRDYKNDSIAVVPSKLVQLTPEGEEFVYVIEGSGESLEAKKVLLKTGKTYEGQVEILAGLNGSERLVDVGARSIKEGDKVRISQ